LLLSCSTTSGRVMDKEIVTDASIPGNGFRLADEWDGAEWWRTCLDYLKIGDIFRLVNQDGTITDQRVLRVIQPLEIALIRDTGNPDPHAKKRAYLGGEMKFEEVDKTQIGL